MKEVLRRLYKRGNRCLKKLNNLLKESEMRGLSPNPRLSGITASVLHHRPVGQFSSNDRQTVRIWKPLKFRQSEATAGTSDHRRKR